MILHSVPFDSAKVVQKKMMYCKSCTEDEYSMVLTTTIVQYISKIQMSCVGLEENFQVYYIFFCSKVIFPA